MADRTTEPGRVCPRCERRVPRSVATCRCGEVLPADDAEAAEPSAKSSPVPVFLLILAVVGGAGYWTYLREPATTPQMNTGAAALVPQSGSAPDEAPRRRELSPEQRAWDAAARMEDAKAAPVSRGPEPTPLAEPALTPALEEMIDSVMASIVLVETTGGRGSAFYVERDTLITNVHVVQQDAYVTLRRMDGSSVSARVHTRAPAFDIAVLKVAQPSPSQPFLPMGSTAQLKPGQEVIVIGSALGTLQNSVSRGIVSGLRDSGGVTLVQSDAAANPGNSGGPMLDRSGRVVGILTAGYRGQEGLNFAVAIDHARDILDGKQSNLGSGAPGLTNIQPMQPGGQGVESDRRQQQGEQDFLRRVESAEQAASQLDQVWQRFRGGCYKSAIRGSYDREWFALFVAGGIPTDAGAGCVDYFQSMQREMNKFRDYLKSAVQDARRANVLPGTIRDTLRSRRLNHEW
jgi:S1-C subfamily serine protease